MKSSGTGFDEVEPGRYLLEDRGDNFRSKAFESHLEQWGWKFEEQMGAGLIYTRGRERITATYTRCGSGLCLVVMHNDLVTASTLQQQRPWNAFL